ncbi:MAG TPA: aminotransferase class IV [Solirubrobacterales bacterium]|nr:aminotransferase class IV [Solirubrobacterales bacterium]
MTPPRKPDPSQGIFETMLVVDGAPVAPEAHLARLEASLEAVYGTQLPAGTRKLLAKHAAGLELGRLRLTFIPGSEIELEFGEIDRSLHFPKHAISLRSYAVSGGLGCHKWADRAALPPSDKGEAAILVAGDEVLEADRANVFAVRKGTVFTPPLDGRILPGVTRATTIELARAEGAEVIEGGITFDQLRQADEVFLTNSIRGIESVGCIDGISLTHQRPFTRCLVAALRSRWRNESGRPEAAASQSV